jgi:hypothetical protein
VTEDRELIAQCAREVLGVVAPQELALFGPTRRHYLQEGALPAPSTRGKDEMLGFGFGGAEMLLTPVVFAVLIELAKKIGGGLLDGTGDAVKERVAASSERALGRLLGGPAAAGAPTLTDRQIAAIRQQVVDHARALNVQDAQARLLADAVVGGLRA